MVVQLSSETTANLTYPDSDGKPMADNTEQFRWIVTIKQNLDWLFAHDPQVFVAGDLLWYPVEGSLKCTAPDVMVVFGRPQGKRGSYKQWQENNIPPQIVFEILSPSNTRAEMNHKLLFYHTYGVEEYYVYDPESHELAGWLRRGDFLEVIEDIENWCSPRLGIRFDLSGTELRIDRPDGQPFLSYIEIAEQLVAIEQQAEQERQRAEQEHQRAERLAAQLRAMGIEPEP
uniref:Putative restriction endonuclease domain-containing protein n=1 Tax=Cyanothece sp. (strain PCC 7425 / ATCC 29141) TaxID=395961 RepID=B8HY01_CYAP4